MTFSSLADSNPCYRREIPQIFFNTMVSVYSNMTKGCQVRAWVHPFWLSDRYEMRQWPRDRSHSPGNSSIRESQIISMGYKPTPDGFGGVKYVPQSIRTIEMETLGQHIRDFEIKTKSPGCPIN